jgi:hypothetical protein
VSFFEHRFEVLRTLEDRGDLRGMNVEEERVSFRVGDAYHAVAFGVNRLDAAVLRPEADKGRIADTINLILEAVQPDRLVRPTFEYQWLVGLDASYDDAREATAAAVVKPPENAPAVDYAVVFDGAMTEPAGTYRLEAGIVEAAEAPIRLSRIAGTFRADAHEVPASIWPVDSVPAVGFFCDSRWQVQGLVEPGQEALFHLWEGVGELASGVVLAVMEKLGVTELAKPEVSINE